MSQFKIDYKKIFKAAVIGGSIFTIFISGFRYLFYNEISILRTIIYFLFGLILYGFLAYRSNKKLKR